MPETQNRTFDEVARDLAFGNIVVGRRTTTLEEGRSVASLLSVSLSWLCCTFIEIYLKLTTTACTHDFRRVLLCGTYPYIVSQSALV
ncbi:hypothetical protein EG68_01659 [Paragonimus skrjabini miyazakii]|uniref:Uncharacterized protein n=1 Tax=Paragonimus skrjabini miyazakii TaxID=59628 RepID=A0A8S9ZBB1_9TREM|nr:hypothetical protein EG68_01659 [Paragonimus skrjabini miyazakii]